METSCNVLFTKHQIFDIMTEAYIYYQHESFTDVRIICQNGSLLAHRLVLCGMSSFLQQLLLSSNKKEDEEAFSEIFLPDFKKEEISHLLSLLYTGNIICDQKEIPSLISLTHLLKLVSIPVTVNKCSDQQLTISENEENINEEEIGDELKDVAQSSKSTSLSSPNSRKDYNEAIKRSLVPDFNDILLPLNHGTDTEKILIRNCALCSKQLLGRNAYGRHMKNVHPSIFGPYICPKCSKEFESGMKIMSHMHTHSNKNKNSASVPQKEDSIQEYSSTSRRFVCNLCSSFYTTNSRLVDHMRKKHEGGVVNIGPSKLTCNASESCNESFGTARAFITHMDGTHGLKPWLCELCSKRFKERQNYQYHVMSHEPLKSFVCDICKKNFSNPRQLYSHRALHLGKRFLCPQCGYRARSSANLRGHIKSKHEGKNFECTYCFKKFGSSNNLKNHLRIHTGEAPYECELCGVKFKRVHHLNSHIESKIHTDIMEKCIRKGISIPERLDPLRRSRGRSVVKDGPLSLLETQEENHHERKDDQPTKIITINEEWSTGQDQGLVVIEEQADLRCYVIPIEDDDSINIV